VTASYWVEALADFLLEADLEMIDRRDASGNTILHYLFKVFQKSEQRYAKLAQALLKKG